MGGNGTAALPSGEVVKILGRPTGIRIVAGKGRDREIDILPLLMGDYPNSNPDEWRKEHGMGRIRYDGEIYKVELSWYYEPSVGIVRRRVKLDKGGNLFYD